MRNRSRFVIASAVAVVAAMAVGVVVGRGSVDQSVAVQAVMADSAADASPSRLLKEPPVGLLGVLEARELVATEGSPGTVTLVGVRDEGRAFTDRPERQEKAMTPQDVVTAFWQAPSNPPNVTISGLDSSGSGFTSIVELSEPSWSGDDLSFTVTSLEGDALDPIPAAASQVSMTIDSASDHCYINVNSNISYEWDGGEAPPVSFQPVPLQGVDTQGNEFSLGFSVPNLALAYGDAPELSEDDYAPVPGESMGVPAQANGPDAWMTTHGSAFEGCAGTVTWDVFCYNSRGADGGPVGQLIVEYANPMTGSYSEPTASTNGLVEIVSTWVSQTDPFQFDLIFNVDVDAPDAGCSWNDTATGPPGGPYQGD